LQVIAKAREQGLACSVQQLFRYPTIQALAREIKPRESDGQQAARRAAFSLVSTDDLAKLQRMRGGATPRDKGGL
jgi:hypothetical protein